MLEKRNNAGIIVALIAVIVAFTAVFVSVSAQMKMDRLELKAADEQTVARMNGVLASEELAEMPLTPVRKGYKSIRLLSAIPVSAGFRKKSNRHL